jgi:hypothetical protein
MRPVTLFIDIVAASALSELHRESRHKGRPGIYSSSFEGNAYFKQFD